MTSHPRGQMRIQTVLCNVQKVKSFEKASRICTGCVLLMGIGAAVCRALMCKWRVLYISRDVPEAEKGGLTSWCLASLWVWSFERLEFLLPSWSSLWGGHERWFLETGESSYSEKTLTPLSVPLWHWVAYPSKPFFGWVGEFRTPTQAAFVLCFHPLEKGSRVAKQETGLVTGSWGGTNAQQSSIMQGCPGETAQGDTKQGTR